MEVKYNVVGQERKELVNVVAEALGEKPVYQKMPTCAYVIGAVTVTKEGSLVYDETVTVDEVVKVKEALKAAGFVAEEPEPVEEVVVESVEDEPVVETPAEAETPNEVVVLNGEEYEVLGVRDVVEGGEFDTAEADEEIVIEIPDTILNENEYENLLNLVCAKGYLIERALGVDDLPIIREDGRLKFKWFKGPLTAEQVEAYSNFVSGIVRMVKAQKHISPKEKRGDNDKYLFRILLLRMGFIGAKYKNTRKILLAKLTGNSAWKVGAPNAKDSE